MQALSETIVSLERVDHLCVQRDGCLCSEGLLSLLGGLTVCLYRGLVVSTGSVDRLYRGLVVPTGRVGCIYREGWLSVQGGLVVCSERIGCLFRGGWLSMQGGLVVCAGRVDRLVRGL